jgi:flagellin
MGVTYTGPTGTLTPDATRQRIVNIDVSATESTGASGGLNFGILPQTETDSKIAFKTPRVLWDKDNGDLQYNVVTIDENGEFKVMKTIISVDNFGDADSQPIGSSGYRLLPATLDTKLKDLTAFYNTDGRMLLDNTQTLSIYGNDKSVDITLEGEDTIKDLVAKLAKALDQLGMAGGLAAEDLVKFVTAAGTGNNAVPGTIVIQAALTGKQSDLKFIGDEGLVNALGMAQIQEGIASNVTVTVKDAHTGDLIGSDTVSDYRLRGIIPGADVVFKSNVGLSASYDTNSNKVVFTPTNLDDVFVHIVNKATSVQVGANEGQMFDISIGRVDCKALEIDDAYVMSIEDSEKAITKFDQALEKVNHARATIGSQINRLEYTIKNLSVGRQNLIAAESRIRDLDVADESSNFAKNQILTNAAVAMLAQANQLPQTALSLIGR